VTHIDKRPRLARAWEDLPDDVPLDLLSLLCALQQEGKGEPLPSKLFNNAVAQRTLWDPAAAGRAARALERHGYVEPIGRGTPGFVYRMTEKALRATEGAPEPVSREEVQAMRKHGIRKPDYFRSTLGKPASKRAENNKKERDRREDEDTSDHDSTGED